MQRQVIPITTLLSPKMKPGFHKRSNACFFQLAGTLKTKRKSDVPVEVYSLSNVDYYVAEGVHRAKAPELVPGSIY
jgi:hypothetical protein